MSTLISKTHGCALLLAVLSGCEGGTGSPGQQQTSAAKHNAADGKVECALAGSDRFMQVCTTEQVNDNGAIMLVIRHPDGGFRRFNVLTNGRGLAPADGFDETRIRLLEGSLIELSSGDDKYRLPAQIKTSGSAEGASTPEDAG